MRLMNRITGLVFLLMIVSIPEILRADDPMTRVPLERVIMYDFEHLELGPVGEGGPSQGEPHELSWAAAGQVDVIEGSIDGKSLEITHPASGAPTAWFQLPGNVGLASGQIRFNFQVRPPVRDAYAIYFREPGSARGSYLTIEMRPTGVVRARSGLSALVDFGSYEAGELLEFTIDFDLDQMSWSAWFNGMQPAEDRDIQSDVEEGLGRIGFNIQSSAEEGRTLEFDNIEILLNAPGVTLLHADFSDKTVGEPIGTGGAALGEPIAVSALLDTWIGDEGAGERVLYLMKEDGTAGSHGDSEWDFIAGASVQTGWLDARFDLILGDLSNNHFILAGGEEELIRIVSTVDGEMRVRFPDQSSGDVVGSYEIGDHVHARIVCQMDERFCSVALDGGWVVDQRAFADDTPLDLAVDRFFAGIAAVSRDFALFGIDNLHISATAPSALPVSAQFIQQPTDTVCQMAFDPAPTVLVTDGMGAPMPGEWTLLVSEYTSVLGWNPFVIDDDPVTVDGLAELDDIRIRGTGEGARMQVVVEGYSPTVMAISQPFDALPGPLTNAYYEGDDDDGPFVAGRPQALWVGVWDDCNNNAPIGTEAAVVIHAGPDGASLSGNAGVVDEWGEIELLEFNFDSPGEYVLDLEIDGVRLESLSSPFVVGSDRIFSDRFQALPE